MDDTSLEELLSRTTLRLMGSSHASHVGERFYEEIGLEGRRPAEEGYDLRAHWMPKRV